MANLVGFSRDYKESVVSSWMWGWGIVGETDADRSPMGEDIVREATRGLAWGVERVQPGKVFEQGGAGSLVEWASGERAFPSNSIIDVVQASGVDATVAVWPHTHPSADVSIVLLATKAFIVGLGAKRANGAGIDMVTATSPGMVVLAHTKRSLSSARIIEGTVEARYWEVLLEREPRVAEKLGRYATAHAAGLAAWLAGAAALCGIRRQALAADQSIELPGQWYVQRLETGCILRGRESGGKAKLIPNDRWLCTHSDDGCAATSRVTGMLARICGRFVVVIDSESEQVWQLDLSGTH